MICDGRTECVANAAMAAAMEKTTPIPWANRLGFPATSFSWLGKLEATNLVAICPRIEIFGPAARRAMKP